MIQTSSNLSLFHILMVEDNQGDIFLIKEALEEISLVDRVSVAINGDEAVDFLEERLKMSDIEGLPDLILLDINLPKRSGIEVLQYVKSHPVFKRIPIIMLTSSSADQDIDQCYRNHANCYITKPIEMTELNHVIQTIENFWLKLVRLPDKL